MKNNFSAWVGIVICFVIAFALGIPSVKDYVALKSAPNIYDLKESELKEELMVRGTADTVIDYYCYETNDGNETFRWYLVPADVNMEKFIGIKVPAKLFSNYEAVCDSFWDYFEGKSASLTKSITYQGRLKKLDGEVKSNLNEWINASGYTQDVSDAFLMYYIDLKTTKASFFSMIASGIFLLAGIGILVYTIVKAKNDKKFDAMAKEMHANNPWSNGISLVIDDNELNAISGGQVATEAPKPDAVNPTAFDVNYGDEATPAPAEEDVTVSTDDDADRV